MLTRRRALTLSGAVVSGSLFGPRIAGAAALFGRARAAVPAAVTLGVLQFGTAAWEIAAMRGAGRAAANGVSVETRRFATNDAGRIAFQARDVDAIVTDLLWAARVCADGRDLVYLPFSSSEGAVMVPGGSSIASVADLKGRRIGVAGGALDKSWLMLQAHARQAAGLDLARASTPAYGAPPLLAQKLEQGELDAALLYWTSCARLEPKGYRRLIGVDDLVRGFGLAFEPALVGYVFDGAFARANAPALQAFAAASRATKDLLGADAARSDAVWAEVRPLMQAEDEATFAALRRGFVAGIPRRPLAEEMAAAGTLYRALAELGGERLVGSARALPDGLYWAGGEGAR